MRREYPSLSRSRKRTTLCGALCLMASFLGHWSATARAGLAEEAKRPVTVADSIGMTIPADDGYYAGEELAYPYGCGSPDGRKLAFVVRRGLLRENGNEYTLMVIDTNATTTPTPPQPVLRVISSSNRPGIASVKWVNANTLAFLMSRGQRAAQVYSLRLSSRKLTQLTSVSANTTAFDISSDMRTIAFVTERTPRPLFTKAVGAAGLVVQRQSIWQLMNDRDADPWEGGRLFVRRDRERPIEIGTSDEIESSIGLTFPVLSPNGRYLAFNARVRSVPEPWKAYDDNNIRRVANGGQETGKPSWLSRYWLYDVQTRRARVLLDAPIEYPPRSAGVAWRPDSRSVVVNDVFPPLRDQLDPAKHARPVAVSVNVSYGIPDSWVTLQPAHGSRSAVSEWQLRVKEDLNSPPQVWLSNRKSGSERMILDLNPQFRHLNFAHVEELTWKDSTGRDRHGGLYYPPGFQKGNRYPLVIQTHGFLAHRFSMDGLNSSGYAAQALAARGILVLQMDLNPDADFIGPSYVAEERSSIEAAIDQLDAQGLIDPTRMGIVGFSITGIDVKSMMVGSKWHFAAAAVEDDNDLGYLQYLLSINSSPDRLALYRTTNGGSPFAGDFGNWIRSVPVFSAEKVSTPLRIIISSQESILWEWEWLAALKDLRKPVEAIYFRNGDHVIVRPSERVIAQEGNVDWFLFWLLGQVDRAPSKRTQYERWHELCSTQKAQNPSMKVYCGS